MSVYIKGMKMPDKDEVITLRIWGNGQVEALESYHSYLLSGVRASEVPPHGDLVDAQEILSALNSSDFSTYEDYEEAFDAVDNATVIIPADGGTQNV